MILKDIFSKPVDRPIEGVIKADDDASLRVEMEEYVLTNEIEKRLESFLDAYNNYAGANGVWVSGFFGSGKSHLLKMLAFLIENREIDGIPSLDFFLPKCGHNVMLQGALNKAASIPSKSILFNIDQKADVISKTQIDALLAVFVKVFDEMCGYYGKQGHIAQFERDLNSRGLLGKFRQSYEAIAGQPWEKGREQVLLEGKNVSQAYAQATGDDDSLSSDIIGKYRSQYRVSIEDFAEQVQAYIEKQAPNFRLNFFVDEAGQYIAENVKLMTNLQTIAESLATKCRGRAWIIVTAQEDMEKVTGDMNKQQAHDFSKIQARFKNRMKLTSQDVDEVIQKRLLEKNDAGVPRLFALYQQQANNFKTLFDFADGSHSYRNFKDKEHFTYCYPFIPYQFSLFQSAIQGLSQHNAFEGKHSSVGERSMLGVFQQVAIQIGEYPVGRLATFDLMFEGIRTALKSQIQRAILQAENNLDNAFAIRLLKSLFLVKYIKEFKPTIRNLCILMLEGFDQDIPSLKKQIEEALNVLELQTYIQRNGELYHYLTDEEKDVEEEIKNTDIETSDVLAELENLIFDRILRDKKVRYENGQDYPFARKLDDKLYGHDAELSINIITPFHEYAENENALLAQNIYRIELLVILPPDKRLMDDLLMYKRTDKYIRQNTSLTQQESVKRILADKGFQNQERQGRLLQQAQNLMGKAKLYIMGSLLDPEAENAQAHVFKGFQALITRVYPHLRMLRASYTENDIGKYLRHAEQGGLTDPLGEVENEALTFINAKHQEGIRTTIKSLREYFERRPYGWYYAAILCILAKLCAYGKVEIQKGGEVLDKADLEKAIRNSNDHGNLVLVPQVEFTASQVRALKDLHEELFDSPGVSSDAKVLASNTSTALRELSQEIQSLVSQASQFPFLHSLEPPLDALKNCQGKPHRWYIEEFVQQGESLLQMKEELLDPIRAFMNGPQRGIYESSKAFMKEQEANITYIEDDSAKQISAVLNAPDCFKGGMICYLAPVIDALRGNLQIMVAEEQNKAQLAVTEMKESILGMSEFAALSAEQRAKIEAEFDFFAASLAEQRLIPVIRDSLHRFKEEKYTRIIAQVVAWAQPDQGGDGVPEKPGGESKPGPIKPQSKPEVISIRATKIPFNKILLANEADVDSYLKSVREALLEAIRQGKSIQI